MALQFQHVDPDFYKQEENEIEVSLEDEQETTVAAENGNFEGSPNGPEKLKNQGIPDQKDDVIHYIGDDIKDESHGSHQGSGHPQLEKQENLAAARVPQFRRTRPRIQLGLTPRQLSELEEVFEQTKYPDEATRRDLAKRLFLGESRVRSWFKRRRAKYRKTQQSQMLKCESADRQNTLQ
ncbi:rhox homeobox family member 1-like [Peromyscus californicus insignis]|uniref:rhox homeobox family member 1-like n=1 Tax=Peromyscus californicus insignis TaxID=564181 RepID=UPI0022A69C13|nr:rhox homeobox family member 1-like [Peromyscus californicus insignis]